MAEKSKWTKWKEVTGGWKKLNNERFLNLYSYSHIVRVLKWGRILTRVVHVAPKIKIRNACKIIVRKHRYR